MMLLKLGLKKIIKLVDIEKFVSRKDIRFFSATSPPSRPGGFVIRNSLKDIMYWIKNSNTQTQSNYNWLRPPSVPIERKIYGYRQVMLPP